MMMDEESEQTKKEAAADQAFAYIADVLPPMLWRFRKNLLSEGFSGSEAWYLTVEYLKALATSGAAPKE